MRILFIDTEYSDLAIYPNTENGTIFYYIDAEENYHITHSTGFYNALPIWRDGS